MPPDWLCNLGEEGAEGHSCSYLGGLVFGGSDQVSSIRGPLEVCDGGVELVDWRVVEEVPGLSVVLRNGSVLVAGDDVLAHVAPSGNGSLALVADDGHDLLVALLSLDIDDDIQYHNSSQVSHALLGDAEQLGAVLVELDSFDRSGEVPGLQTLAGLDVPEADRVVGRARGDEGRGRVNVDSPDGTLVAMVCS